MKTTSPSLLANKVPLSSVGALARRGMTLLRSRFGLTVALAFCLLAACGSSAHAAACKRLIIKPTITTVNTYSDGIVIKSSVTVSGGSGHYLVDVPVPSYSEGRGYDVGSDLKEVRGKPGQTTVCAVSASLCPLDSPDIVNQFLTVSDLDTGVYERVSVSYKINSKYGEFGGVWNTEEGAVLITVSGTMFKASSDHFTVIGKVTGNGTVLDGTFYATPNVDPNLLGSGYKMTIWSNPKYKSGRFVATLSPKGGWTAKWGWGPSALTNVLNGSAR